MNLDDVVKRLGNRIARALTDAVEAGVDPSKVLRAGLVQIEPGVRTELSWRLLDIAGAEGLYRLGVALGSRECGLHTGLGPSHVGVILRGFADGYDAVMNKRSTQNEGL